MDIYAPVSSIMTPEPISVHPKDSLAEVKEIFSQKHFHHLPVVKNGEVLGMVSKSDMLLFSRKAYFANNETSEDIRHETFSAEDIMVKGLAKVNPNDHIATVLLVFKENLFHAVPVVDDHGKLVGIITTFDIIKTLLNNKG